MNIPRYGTNMINETYNNTIDRYQLRNQSFDNHNRVTRINIDSRFRNKIPKNIISKTYSIENELNFIQNSNIVTINLPSTHSIKKGNFITLNNLIGIKIRQHVNTITLKKNDHFCYIYHSNHGFIGTNNKINISNYNPTTEFIGNIPVDIINADHNVILIENSNIIDPNNYKIDLKMYSNIDYNINIIQFYTLTLLTLGGIDIKYINANYPITNDVQIGYHEIIESNSNTIKIMLQQKASNTLTNVGGKIIIGIIDKTITGFSDPSHYIFNLPRIFTKVEKIRLVSSEIPNSESLIKSQPSDLKNNLLYWKILDDGNNLYSICLEDGNYNSTQLANKIIEKINNTERVFGSYLNNELYYTNCICNCIIDIYTNIFSLIISGKITSNNNISINNTVFIDGYKRINITHPYHNLNVGNKITISGAINVLDSIVANVNYYIPSDIINATHEIESINGINNYTVKLNKYNIETSTYDNTIIFGGNAVTILYPLSIQLLFNKKGTIYNILGFNENDITIFDKKITNRTERLLNNTITTTGTKNISIPLLNLTTYPYIVVASPIFSDRIDIKNSSGIFAKLFLTGDFGSTIYDQYVQLSQFVTSSYSDLNNIEFFFYNPNGKLYNFNNRDHSFTIEIYEKDLC